MRNDSENPSRRTMIKKVAATTAAAIVGENLFNRVSAAEQALPDKLKGHINHSVCRWCYGSISLDDLCKAAKEMGIASIDLVGPDEWPTLKNTA
jgi:hydroxypyruvate isomerase